MVEKKTFNSNQMDFFAEGGFFSHPTRKTGQLKKTRVAGYSAHFVDLMPCPAKRYHPPNGADAAVIPKDDLSYPASLNGAKIALNKGKPIKKRENRPAGSFFKDGAA